MTDLLTTPVTTLHDEPTTFAGLTGGQVALVVNVASKCGLTPQYAGLEELHRELADKAFTVIGFPCNQFGEQEPGSAEEIETFCSTTYGVTFPMSAKIEVNGPGRDAVYDILTAAEDDKGESGDVQWNFEKFLVAADGKVLRRFRPMVEPDDDELRTAIETALEG
ncbi:MAG TPA: glutathione peroxidase [Mycobacteriales bacterium]|jgi:glutathione peroxidase|nr:glutathione peroxidase [Mycobacteriales bacterium]